MSPVLVAVALISCVVLVWIMKNAFVKGNLPPGPTPLPLLGNLLQIKKMKFVRFLNEMRRRYGNIFTFYLGSRPVLVVSGYQELKDVFYRYGEEFSGRGETPTFTFFYDGFGFALTSNMKIWRELRRFSMGVLREFGRGKTSIEFIVQEEVENLVKEFEKCKESVIDPKETLAKASANVIFYILLGQRFEYDDEDLNKLIHWTHDTLYRMGSDSGQLSDIVLGFLKHQTGTHKRIFQNMKNMASFMKSRVDEHQKTLDPSFPRDYTDAFLLKMEQMKDDPDTEYNMKNLISSTLQIFFAGIETVSRIMSFALLLLLKHPDVQEKVHEEIDRVIGRDRRPVYQDRVNMPYTEAVMHEILRYSDLAPYGIPRTTIQDTEFYGYSIPKGTTTILLLTTALNDPDIFPNPKSFKPGNFLDADGNFQKSDAFLAFAAGKRNCLGENLARIEIFIFLTTILQSFRLKSPLPLCDINITHVVTGLGNHPKPYTLRFESR
uniref:Uncharacterized protein n=1 Tax=Leptobrachium leishanense TaxID=445787 RepID=A0A8C5QP15_9ANUR